MKTGTFILSITLALVCSRSFAAQKGGTYIVRHSQMVVYGMLSEPPAGGDAAIIAIMTYKFYINDHGKQSREEQTKIINLTAADNEIATKIKKWAKEKASPVLDITQEGEDETWKVTKIIEEPTKEEPAKTPQRKQ